MSLFYFKFTKYHKKRFLDFARNDMSKFIIFNSGPKMSNNIITRFTIHKDAHEYLSKETGISPAHAICGKEQFSVDYT